MKTRCLLTARIRLTDLFEWIPTVELSGRTFDKGLLDPSLTPKQKRFSRDGWRVVGIAGEWALVERDVVYDNNSDDVTFPDGPRHWSGVAGGSAG